MSTKRTKQATLPMSLAGALETLRGHVVELEAVAHAAEEALQHLPYVPREPAEPGEAAVQYTDKQLGMGRLQAMVAATSCASRSLLQELDRLLRIVQEPGESRYATRSGTGSSRVGERWNPKLLYEARLGTLPEPA